MDFGTLLHMAKKNSEGSKNDGKYYSTKFAPPKKESKEKKLSDNIQKFLQKKEQEEKAKQREQQEKLNALLSMRDEKSKNKIRKMLKVTKSANRSVLEDAVNNDHTAITMAGPEQPDQDDYGYVSTEANNFFQKYVDKVKDVKEDKGFAPSRPQSLKDLTGTKERVKAAITREIEEKNSHTRTRTPKEHSTSSSSGINVARNYKTSSKTLYDPDAEKRAEEEERKKREEEARKKRHENRKMPPPPMDFQALLKLAEKKQHQPISLPIAVPKKKEPERLLTSKEKKELEERQRAKEAREQRQKERLEEAKKGPSKSSSTSSSVQRMEPNGRIPKLSQSGTPSSSNGTGKSSSSSEKKDAIKKPSSSSSSSLVHTSKSSSGSSNATSTSSSTSSSKSSASTKSLHKPSASSSSVTTKTANSSSMSSKNPYGSSSKPSYDGPTREFPPRDIKTVKSREFPPPDVQKTRQFPPPDVRRGPPPSSSRYGDSKKSSAPKRRILDDDDSEYDSELDDFIDDGEEEEDYSSHIKAIFGYDKSKYRDIDEEDDRMMEASFAQIQREEFISKKIGMQEDLEDMKMEAMQKKRKMMMKKRRLDD
ncbi:protein SPT2 homolog [Haematobia irritans]|uniref:protein SPT2 homolog n=1 Tax=Haematobia irritans TaxID=7368 RepID=UPI003F50B728